MTQNAPDTTEKMAIIKYYNDHNVTIIIIIYNIYNNNYYSNLYNNNYYSNIYNNNYNNNYYSNIYNNNYN